MDRHSDNLSTHPRSYYGPARTILPIDTFSDSDTAKRTQGVHPCLTAAKRNNGKVLTGFGGKFGLGWEVRTPKLDLGESECRETWLLPRAEERPGY